MKNYLISVWFLLSFFSFLQVQENLLMERFNMNAFIPVFLGSEGREVAFTSRSTWIGVADAPRVNYFFYSGGQKKLSLDCN